MNRCTGGAGSLYLYDGSHPPAKRLHGTLIGKVILPVPNVTSCVFGGEDMDMLFITTARQELDEDALKRFPESGHVFVAKVGVKGLPSNRFYLPMHQSIY